MKISDIAASGPKMARMKYYSRQVAVNKPMVPTSMHAVVKILVQFCDPERAVYCCSLIHMNTVSWSVWPGVEEMALGARFHTVYAI